MKTIRIGLLGMGTVGTGILKILKENGEIIRERQGLDLEIVRILVKDGCKARKIEGVGEILTTDPKDILNDMNIDLLCECLSGEEPAFSSLMDALEKGISVVTANKSVVAKNWLKLEETAAKSGAGLYYEASVGGAIPVIRAIENSLQANRIQRITGILNGTTNYILTRMSDEGMDYAEALLEAQRLGYAEADPAADVEGHDARNKLSILTALAFRNWVRPENIPCQGITAITSADIKNAKDEGAVIKLLAACESVDGKMAASVKPVLIPKEHPLAGIRDSFNAVSIEGDMAGSLLFTGRGAGALPTASAMVSDMVTAALAEGNHPRRILDRKNQGTCEKNKG